VQSDTVHVPFDQYREILTPHSITSDIEGIESPTLRVDGRFRRIQILGLSFTKDSSTESDNLPRFAANGKHDTPAKAIVRPAGFARLNQSTLDEKFRRKSPVESANQIV
jgi:hypothetical protein